MVDALQRQLGGTRLETHISYVLVCGGLAYKIKKALKTAFLDQSTLALRQHACNEELRLNRRLAPALYLGVVPITGDTQAPQLGGDGALIDVAVKMRAFAQDGLWDTLAARGELHAAQIDELARLLVPFHDAAAVAAADGRLGSPAQVRAPLLDSLRELDTLVDDVAGATALRRLRAWEAAAFARLAPVLAGRLAAGRVRECHGDLHLGNVTTVDGRATVFDGIDFNLEFRWIDVISEVAFMAMDLQARGLGALAHRFVNAYLEAGGDYEGVRVLDYYLVHRALVRAKVALLRAAQCRASPALADEAGHQHAAAQHYLALALRYSRATPAHGRAALLLTHGYSGSGKSTLTQGLVETAGAIRIRADVERKRLAGLAPLDAGGAAAHPGLYGDAMTAATYTRLNRLALPVLESGYPVVLDATFLQRWQRDAARAVAAARQLPCRMLDFDAEPELLRQRLRARRAAGGDVSDADEHVLALQMQQAEALQPDEAGIVFRCRADTPAPGAAPQVDWAPLLRELAA